MSDKKPSSESIDDRVEDVVKKSDANIIYERKEETENPYYKKDNENQPNDGEESEFVDEESAQNVTKEEIKESIFYMQLGLPYQQSTGISARDQEQNKVRSMRSDICSMNMVLYDLESRAA